MKTNIISTKSIFPNSYRFDPSFHLSEAIVLIKDLDNLPFDNISIKDTGSKVFLGNIFSRIFVKDKERGIPYLAASDTVLADINTGRFLSKKQAKELAYLMLEKDWIVITCSGTIGNVTYTNSTFENHIATHDLIRIVPNDEKILRGYLYAFLSSKYGYNLLTQSRFGGVIKHINADHVNGIALPLFPKSFQKEVDDLIKESVRFREEATDALENAKNLIEEQFTDFSPSLSNCYVSSKNILSSHNKRFEANYHIAGGKVIEKYIKDNFKWDLLGNLCTKISRPELFKRYYVKNGLPFLGGADLFLASPKSSKQLSKTKTSKIESLVIKEGTILLPRSGTIGDVAWAHYGHAQKLASEHVIRLLPNNILRGGYIYAFLASAIGKSLIQRYVFGSVIQHIEPPHLKLIPVPIFDSNIVDAAHSKVLEYGYKAGLAIQKEEKAISMVEQEIEKWNK